MTAKLWMQMLEDLHLDFKIQQPSFELMQKIAKKNKAAVPMFLYREAKNLA